MKHKKLNRWHLPQWACRACGERYVFSTKGNKPTKAYCASQTCKERHNRLDAPHIDPNAWDQAA